MTTIINLTPHEINIDLGGNRLAFPPSGQIARVSVKNIPEGEIMLDDVNGIPVSKPVYGVVEGLPTPYVDDTDGSRSVQPGVIYIVSMLVAQRCPGRDDIVVPDSGPSAIRGANGQIEAVRGFIRY